VHRLARIEPAVQINICYWTHIAGLRSHGEEGRVCR